MEKMDENAVARVSTKAALKFEDVIFCYSFVPGGKAMPDLILVFILYDSSFLKLFILVGLVRGFVCCLADRSSTQPVVFLLFGFSGISHCRKAY